MFDLMIRAIKRTGPTMDAAAAGGPPYLGPDRRTRSSASWRWLAAALDEVDYGMLLLDEEAIVVHANQAALSELDAEHPLQLLGRELRARHSRDVQPLHAALDAAVNRGLRTLLPLGEGSRQTCLSVVPLGPVGDDVRTVTLVILGKRQLSAELAVQGFARTHQLTPGETRVLVALCNGRDPAEIAALHGVALSTVRSQIGAIRMKTGAPNIRALARQVAVLPPLMGVLRCRSAASASHASALMPA